MTLFTLIFLNFLTNQMEGNETLKTPKINKKMKSKTTITTNFNGIASNPMRVRHDVAKIPIIQRNETHQNLRWYQSQGRLCQKEEKKSRMGSWDGRWRRSNGYKMNQLRLKAPQQIPQNPSPPPPPPPPHHFSLSQNLVELTRLLLYHHRDGKPTNHD